ncbi:MAG TPA: thiamine-phosphate kinase [Spirochaetota bacterium]|nr:thiamine-phosphate kinase [Spirochaetota bacterium]
MKISEIGGEFALIKRLMPEVESDPAIIRGIGDDCAVLAYTADKYLVVTTDMMVENSHFSPQWFTPFQVGKKLVEVNVSDVVAMGGVPRFAFISVALTKDTEVEYMDELYRGIHSAGGKHGVYLIGGDTTHGSQIVLNLTIIGEVEKNLLCLRSEAKAGDLICVTGTLGGNQAGLELLLAGKPGHTIEFLEPECRLASEGCVIARYANAMIDVSDGLGSEVRHICEESGVGARIDCEKIPLSSEVVEAAKAVGGDPYDFAMYGGEDFELVFTVPPGKLSRLKEEFSDISVVGAVLPKEEGIFLIKNNERMDIGRGYDHFAE